MIRAKAHTRNNSERLQQAEAHLDACYRRHTNAVTALRLVAGQPYQEPVLSSLDATTCSILRAAAIALCDANYPADGRRALAVELRKLLREV